MNSTGYGISSMEYLLSILHCDPNVNLKLNYLNKITTLGVSPNRQQIFAALEKKPEESDHIAVFHCIPHRYRRPPKAKKCIGICLFETINPPKDWIKMMNSMDAIITASEFNKNIFLTSGLTVPIHVVPHTFDPKMFNREVSHNGRYDLTTFISIGTWKKRKNWETLIKAFYDAFEKKDRVCLLIKTDKPKELEVAVRTIKLTGEWRSKDTAPIFAENKTNCVFEEIPAFMKKGDIYVSCSLGEGFCLPSFHAMALGIPVIITKFGGCLEYAKPEYCTYIEPHSYKTYPDMDKIPQFRNCIWPVIRIGEVKDKMRQVWQDKQVKDKSDAGYDFVHANFNYDVIGKKMLEAILQ